jgi:hypothetical protein
MRRLTGWWCHSDAWRVSGERPSQIDVWQSADSDCREQPGCSHYVIHLSLALYAESAKSKRQSTPAAPRFSKKPFPAHLSTEAVERVFQARG